MLPLKIHIHGHDKNRPQSDVPYLLCHIHISYQWQFNEMHRITQLHLSVLRQNVQQQHISYANDNQQPTMKTKNDRTTDNTNVNELSTHDYQQTPSITEGIHYTRWNLLQMDKYAYLKMHMPTLFCDGSSETYSVVEQRSNCEWEIPILIICRHTKLYMTTTAQHQIIQTTYKIQLTYTSLSNTCLYLMKHAPFLFIGSIGTNFIITLGDFYTKTKV